jgi:transcription elongation factor Elf1
MYVMENNNCPDCGGAEYIAPVIDNNMAAYLLRARANNSIVTVTCVHCGSKFQKEMSIDMFSAKPTPEAFVAEVKTVTTSEAKSFKSKLRQNQVLAIIVTVPLFCFNYIPISTFFIKERNMTYFFVMLFFIFSTVYFIMHIRKLEKRISRIQKNLKNQVYQG